MEKQRRFKVFSIVALMFAVVALSVGFAAFQKVLNISSSANVSLPSEDNFKLTLYGITSLDAIEDLQNEIIDYSKFSKEKAYALDSEMKTTYPENYATIDNENLSINIELTKLTKSDGGYNFVVFLKNESDFGVYVSLSDVTKGLTLKDNYGIYFFNNGTCVAETGTTQSLVDKTCEYILLALEVSDYTENDVLNNFYDGKYKLGANQVMLLQFWVGYNSFTPADVDADGPFSVDFKPINIEFDTVPHVYE